MKYEVGDIIYGHWEGSRWMKKENFEAAHGSKDSSDELCIIEITDIEVRAKRTRSRDRRTERISIYSRVYFEELLTKYRTLWLKEKEVQQSYSPLDRFLNLEL